MTASLLGLVLAGGRSSRFGGDKALAELDGRTLLEGAVQRLEGWCQEVVVAGRSEAPATTLADWPGPDLGPLGGIAAALRYARERGCAAVLSCGVDSIGLPANLPEVLTPAPACLASQPVVGRWPVAALDTLERILCGDGRHSMLAFAHAIGAREVELEVCPANINTREDLALARRKLASRTG